MRTSPIIDIVIGSMKKDDFMIVRDVWGAIRYRVCYIHKTEVLSKEEDPEISSKLFDHNYRPKSRIIPIFSNSPNLSIPLLNASASGSTNAIKIIMSLYSYKYESTTVSF